MAPAGCRGAGTCNYCNVHSCWQSVKVPAAESVGVLTSAIYRVISTRKYASTHCLKKAPLTLCSGASNQSQQICRHLRYAQVSATAICKAASTRSQKRCLRVRSANIPATAVSTGVSTHSQKRCQCPQYASMQAHTISRAVGTFNWQSCRHPQLPDGATTSVCNWRRWWYSLYTEVLVIAVCRALPRHMRSDWIERPRFRLTLNG